MLSQIMLILPGCFAVGAVFMFLANRHESSMKKRRRWLKFASYAVSFSVCWLAPRLAAAGSRS